MTMDTQWSAGKRNEILREIADRVGELVEAVKEKQTIVPVFFYVPSGTTQEQMKHMADWFAEAMREAGFNLPLPPSHSDDHHGEGGEPDPHGSHDPELPRPESDPV